MQLVTLLVRVIFVRPSKEITHELLLGIIFKVIKPLYRVPEAGIHWYNTYSNYYKDKLSMETLTFNPCLLVTRNKDSPFGIVAMQIDDILILGDNAFVELKRIKLGKAKLTAKPIESLARNTLLIFNGYKLIINVIALILLYFKKNKGNV